MRNDDSSQRSKPTKEELDALFKDMPLFDLKSVRNTLYKRSIRFRCCWIILMLLTLSYVMGWFSGALLPMMASSFTNLEADYQLHQLRFLIGFLMIAAGTIAINFDRNIEPVFIGIFWVQLYFHISGTLRLVRSLPEGETFSLTTYMVIQSTILLLMLWLIIEERLYQRNL
ncbi:hypothetical protein N9Y68_07475 [Luminiphilus sp.]|nr:hypothetical protein [Luminiphilus sp.]